MARVELEKVTKIYPGNVKAVNSIDLQIKDQEFIVLVGPSGCGKSTTLRMVAGLEEISDGVIRIGDRVVNDVPPKNRDIAMVFQNYALYPHMSVYKNMAFGLKLRGMPKPEINQRVMEAAKILDIEHLLERKPKALSGGQRQRVAVGRAIVREPAAFLFDEPLSNLDAKLRVTTRAELKRLHHRLKTTTIYVTHDQEEAMTLGDRVVVMKDGVIQQCAPPLEIYRHPANRFVAGFLGSPPMNFLHGRLEGGYGRLLFVPAAVPGSAEVKNDVGGTEAVGIRRPQLRIPTWAAPALSHRVGSEIVLGFRPQALTALPPGRASDPFTTLAARVQLVEPLGDRMHVRLAVGQHEGIVAELPAREGIA